MQWLKREKLLEAIVPLNQITLLKKRFSPGRQKTFPHFLFALRKPLVLTCITIFTLFFSLFNFFSCLYSYSFYFFKISRLTAPEALSNK